MAGEGRKVDDKVGTEKVRRSTVMLSKERVQNPTDLLRMHLESVLPCVRNYSIYTVWQCKTLQNRKWILCTDLPDNRLYELTYNGDKGEFYLDEYDKVSNTVYLVETPGGIKG